jgi:hypothetical protein
VLAGVLTGALAARVLPLVQRYVRSASSAGPGIESRDEL